MRSVTIRLFTSQNSVTSSSSSSPVYYMNYALISALVAFALAQSIKVFITWYREHRWDPKRLIGSGGMPSSHSATVTALAVAVGLHDGLGGSSFATALILAIIVMYDATGVRLHAGRQAEVLNQIVYELPAEHPLAERMPLHELLGHTPPQVIAGGLLGIMTSTIIYLISHSGNNA
ncbi:putative phosphatidic acid phosphatase type 2/haloperoxidase superfamily [Helianthus annuus]|nr:putative phosphatidic acid phosphatase type 2/haloperoxidase superfamily [Helianthus annuus]